MISCYLCGNFSLSLLCSSCKNRLIPHVSTREIADNFYCYSFFGYHDISPLLFSKHKITGYFLYRYLALKTFKPFLENLNFDSPCTLVPIDDKIKGGYSHTALLAHACKNENFKPSYRTLRATNKVTYSGQSLSFRKAHKRGFVFLKKPKTDIILIDDIVTTGTTLHEAYQIAIKNQINPLFAMTLADAKVK